MKNSTYSKLNSFDSLFWKSKSSFKIDSNLPSNSKESLIEETTSSDFVRLGFCLSGNAFKEEQALILHSIGSFGDINSESYMFILNPSFVEKKILSFGEDSLRAY